MYSKSYLVNSRISSLLFTHRKPHVSKQNGIWWQIPHPGYHVNAKILFPKSNK